MKIGEKRDAHELDFPAAIIAIGGRPRQRDRCRRSQRLAIRSTFEVLAVTRV